jgi:hypothetical protein
MKTGTWVEIYKERDTGDMLIMRYSLDAQGGWLTSWGEFVEVKSHASSDEMWNKIKDSLGSVEGTEKADKSALDRLSGGELAVFRKRHVCVGIGVIDEGLVLQPMHPGKKGGQLGLESDRRTLAGAINAARFAEALSKAFDTAT